MTNLPLRPALLPAYSFVFDSCVQPSEPDEAHTTAIRYSSAIDAGATRQFPGPVSRAIALVAAFHGDIAKDSPRLRHALECWTGLNRAATRRWLCGEATREATHEVLASTLQYVLRTFGPPQTGRAERLSP